MSHDYTFGVAWFNDEKSATDGLAAVAGEEAEAIRSIGDLRSDVYWWTNLSRSTLYDMRLLRRPQIKRNTYLLTNIKALRIEMGLDDRGTPADEAVCLLAEVFSRVMNLAITHYGVGEKGLMGEYLSDDLYAVLVPEDFPISSDVDLACLRAYQNRVDCTAKWPANTRGVRFGLSRISHALDVLSTPIPSGDWTLVQGSDLGPPAERAANLLKCDRPVLAKASFSKVAPEYAPLIVVSSENMRNDRSYMSQPELVFMNKFSTLRIEHAYIASSYRRLTLNKPLFLGEDLGPLSLSVGLLAESCLAALLYRRPFAPGRQHGFITPRAAWLSAADRFHCLMGAASMRALGYTVMNYGVGSVLIALTSAELEPAGRCAEAIGLLPPVHPYRQGLLAKAAA
jgi:hypothetical protein